MVTLVPVALGASYCPLAPGTHHPVRALARGAHGGPAPITTGFTLYTTTFAFLRRDQLNRTAQEQAEAGRAARRDPALELRMVEPQQPKAWAKPWNAQRSSGRETLETVELDDRGARGHAQDHLQALVCQELRQVAAAARVAHGPVAPRPVPRPHGCAGCSTTTTCSILWHAFSRC